MAAKYQVYRDVAGKFRFRLKTAEDRIVVVSEAYEQHTSALNGVKSIQNNCTVAIEDLTVEGPRINFPKYQIFKDKASEFRFRLTASNGQIIGASEAYETKEACQNGIKTMQESCNAEIEDLTVAPIAPEPPEEPEPMMEKAAMTTAVGGAAVSAAEMETPPTPPPADMMTAEPKLELFKLPVTVAKGDVVYFKGKLSKGNMGIPQVKIRIFEHDRSFMLDAAWAKGYTNQDGTFTLSRKVTPPHFWDNSAKIYAQADGDQIKRLRSDIQKIIIE
jgi:uncharacterized protein YegP (UPF0339 family)